MNALPLPAFPSGQLRQAIRGTTPRLCPERLTSTSGLRVHARADGEGGAESRGGSRALACKVTGLLLVDLMLFEPHVLPA